MSTVVDRFAAEHFTLNSISEPRRAQVRVALARFEAFREGPVEEATDTELRSWLVSLLDAGLAPSTVAFYLRAVTPFYRWCWQNRIIDAESLMRISDVAPPRGSRHSVPRPYTSRELARMWAELEAKFPRTTEDRFKRYRNGTGRFRQYLRQHTMRVQLEAIIELALVCGLRQNEIYHLSLDDVHWDNAYIPVRYAKREDQNPKERDVPYPDSTRAIMREWFRLRTYMQATTGCLWLSVTGPVEALALPRPRMAHILHHQVGPEWQLHRLRHTCATERLRAGMPIEALQRFLGHANLQQTLGYAQLVRHDVHKAAARSEVEFQRAIRVLP